MRLFQAVAISIFIAPAAASEFREVSVSNHNVNSGIVTLYLTETILDQKVNCAVYDERGTLIASRATYADNLATEVQILTPDAEQVRSWRCVLNE